MSQHSEYSPSQLSRIIACPGSVSLCKEVPKPPTSPHAAEGTLLHSYMEQTLDIWPEVPEIVFDEDKKIDHAMAIEACMEHVLQHTPLDKEGTKIFVEMRVQMSNVEEVYGTIDLGVYTPDAIHIYDWKFGRGVEVSAKNNPQLLSYMDGFIRGLKQGRMFIRPATKMFVHVVQPRIDNFQVEEISIADLQQHEHKVQMAITMSRGKNPPFNPGPEQCRWCAAAAICKYRISQAQLDVEAAFAAVVDIENNRANIGNILALLEKKSDIEMCLKQIKQYALLELIKGNKVPNFKLVRGRANRQWAPGVTFDTLIMALPEDVQCNFEDLVKIETKSPAQVEKILPKSCKEIFNTLIVKPEGALTIAPANSSKPEVQITDPESVYASIISSEDEE